ncbi:MAG: tetratricopeptide repeat protein, partial [Candidatus Solibacter usitatus]|nr:tetratricopeptide repeat protein [Candidatus Solibacter usitatus]
MSEANERWVWSDPEPIAVPGPPDTAWKWDEADARDEIPAAAGPPVAVPVSGVPVQEVSAEAAPAVAPPAVAPAPETAGNFAAMGRIEFDAGRFEEALGYWGRVEGVAAGYNEAVCLERLERWPEAAQAFQAVLDQDPAFPDAWLGLGISRLNLGDTEEALDAFEQVLQRDPEQRKALFGRAVALHLLERDEDAEGAYLALLAKDPNS